MDYDNEHIPLNRGEKYTPYVKPTLQWYPHKKRQKGVEKLMEHINNEINVIGVEKRIRSLLRRRKAFYLETTDFEGNNTIWSVSGFGWASDKSGNPDNDLWDHTIGHINNCLEFLDGPQSLWEGKKRSTRRRRTVKRGLGI